ncbi:MAG TPA: pyridoxal-dependent decarboxylase, partial [Gammaproteobacteria bacterium]|nr:pyridoxal-dependent decarboxylase [Gammaproteobacteria bacterium]
MKAPELPEKYNIESDVSGISIDKHVLSVFKKSLESPILKTGFPDELSALLDSRLPRKGFPLESVLEELESAVAKYSRKNAHPGCWAYVTSPGLPTDPLGHAITAALNQNVTGYHSAPGASIIEQIVIDWMLQLAEMPEGAGGLLQGGGSLANLSALAVARDQALGE